MAATKLLSERDLRRMLELVAQVGRTGRDSRWSFLVTRLMALTEADAGLMLRVRRKRGQRRFDVLVQHGPEGAPEVAPPDAERLPAGEQVAQSIVPLRGTGHYACLKLFRAKGFSPRQIEMTDFVWQSLSGLHDV